MRKYSLLLLLLFIISACDEPELRYFTRINNDGTVYKRVSAVGDSAKVYDDPFSFDVSDGWLLTYKKEITNSDTLFFAIAEKSFPSIEASSKAFYHDVDTGSVENIKVEYEKRFRWFFTFHSYRETFLQIFPYRHYNINDFLSDNEKKYFLADDTTVINHLNQKEKDAWNKRGEEHIFSYLSKSLSSEYINLLDSFAVQKGYNTLNKTQKEIIDDFVLATLDDGLSEDLIEVTDSVLGSDWVSGVYRQGYFNKLESNWKDKTMFWESRDYKVQFELPGLIYKTNAPFVDNHNCKWEFRLGEFHYCDKVLFTEYRTTNWWAFIITFVVIVLLLWKAFAKK
nr:hypothetical protein [uncultured Carboxylicivirga sp.]